MAPTQIFQLLMSITLVGFLASINGDSESLPDEESAIYNFPEDDIWPRIPRTTMSPQVTVRLSGESGILDRPTEELRLEKKIVYEEALSLDSISKEDKSPPEYIELPHELPMAKFDNFLNFKILTNPLNRVYEFQENAIKYENEDELFRNSKKLQDHSNMRKEALYTNHNFLDSQTDNTNPILYSLYKHWKDTTYGNENVKTEGEGDEYLITTKSEDDSEEASILPPYFMKRKKFESEMTLKNRYRDEELKEPIKMELTDPIALSTSSYKLASKDSPLLSSIVSQIKNLTTDWPKNRSAIPGLPGIDYPTYNEVPYTGFDCKMQRYKGFFADQDAKCQAWHYCDFSDGQSTFLCPNGTLFSQVIFTCDWWFNVDCNETQQLYVLNERLYRYIKPPKLSFPEDFHGPLVDDWLIRQLQMGRLPKVKKTSTNTTKILM